MPARGPKVKSSGGLVFGFDLDQERFSGKEAPGLFGPLDDHHVLRRFQQVQQPQPLQLAWIVDPVKVEMVQVQPTVMLMVDREGGARDGLGVDAHPGGHRLNPAGLAGSQIPLEEDQLPPAKQAAEFFGDGPGLIGRAGRMGQGAFLHLGSSGSPPEWYR